MCAELQDLLPGIINQLGPDNLANLKKLAETYQSGGAPPPAAVLEAALDTAGRMPFAGSMLLATPCEQVPDLVDNFEEASK